ncbi:Mediator of RNA polymerase II transcription subunit like [Actinidia chinensis var. chinensis]|uniref:Mediator of RNA polymerase II transcription subunit like n=1 Tax=Actinidia chinensis var. chinensis TaxID=1590841 RepID=A0A2R6RR19_ACTCC|nr:Mediator of RNA polymerase II transcription subunit like [Actinidia chinensis var. chinensis]
MCQLNWVIAMWYPHCLYFLELLQNSNFRNAMAHPGNKATILFLEELQELKHILPRPLPEPVTAPPASVPPPPPIAPTTISMSAVPPPLPASASAPSPALSPMQYTIPPGSALAKNDPRNSGVDRRKRKKEV